MDALKNFSYGTVQTAPTPAASGTSLVLNSGEGSNFPTVPFNAWVWPPSVQPLMSNAEIVRVTNISTDTLTITRAQEGTSAKSIAVGWQVAAGLTKKYLDDIESRIYTSTLGWETLPITLTYSSADDPTFVASASADPRDYLSVGMKLEVTQGTVRYFFITALSATTVTMYGGTDYDLANAAIDSVRFSSVKAPYGFPINPTKWAVELTDATTSQQNTPTQNVWYNPDSNSISIPIGIWNVHYQATPWVVDTAVTSVNVYVTLSTANNSESDGETWTASVKMDAPSGTLEVWGSVYRSGVISVSSKTSYYLNIRTTLAGIQAIALVDTKKIRAVCAYL
jgi:hypothetical protein